MAKKKETKKLGIMETAIRDGQQSLIATRMPFEDMEPALALIRETLELTEEDMLVPFSAEKGNGKDELLAEIMNFAK